MGEINRIRKARKQFEQREKVREHNKKLSNLCRRLVAKAKQQASKQVSKPVRKQFSRKANFETTAVKTMKGYINYGYPKSRVATLGDYPTMKALYKGHTNKASIKV